MTMRPRELLSLEPSPNTFQEGPYGRIPVYDSRIAIETGLAPNGDLYKKPVILSERERKLMHMHRRYLKR